MDSDLAFASAVEIRSLIAARQVSPVEVTRVYLERIERVNPKLNAYLTVVPEQAMESARAAERAVMAGAALGPLHGVPVSIKDLEATKGIRSTSGSLALRDRVPEEDGIVSERVRRAGAVILGKTNTSEFGFLAQTENRLGGSGRNPWDLSCTCGGSSGGAGAAVAAGLCALATGSDGGGSIRVPSSYCGVYGIKPTFGRVPSAGSSRGRQSASMFGQAGPLTRSVRDAALLLQVMAGYDARDPAALRDAPEDYLAACGRGAQGLRVAWSPDFGHAAVDPGVLALARNAALSFESMGCSVEEVDLALEPTFDHFWKIMLSNAYANLEKLVEARGELLAPYTREFMALGARVTGAEYARALGVVERLRARFADLFEKYDLLLTPTTATTAFPLGKPPSEIGGREVDLFWGFTPFTFPVNMVGAPAASIPCGTAPDGLPVGLHIVGRPGAEATVLAASAAYEALRPWRRGVEVT
ncbi:MAG: amidase [SAR202 cluster bacterium]|nr:amidase [SAR202 cluster bacterium]